MLYRYQSKNGGYKLKIEDRIAICEFNGVCSDGVAKHYLLDIMRVAKEHKDSAWVYLADTIDHLVAIPTAEPYLTEAYEFCSKHNCIGDAYCMTSPMAAAQLQRLREKCRLPDTIENRIFPTLNQAIDFLAAELVKHDGIQTKDRKAFTATTTTA